MLGGRERLEQQLPGRGPESHAGVRHLELERELLRIAWCEDGYGERDRPFRRVFDGVAQKIGEQLLTAARIAEEHRRQGRIQADRQIQARASKGGTQPHQRIVDDIFQQKWYLASWKRFHIGTCVVEYRVQHHVQFPSTLFESIQIGSLDWAGVA